MINLRIAPACARIAVVMVLAAAGSAVAMVLIAAPGISAASAAHARATILARRTTTSTTTTSTTTTTTTTTTATTLASAVAIHGKTSQRRPISFKLSLTAVTRLNYRIVDRCPRGRHLFVHSWGFPRLTINDSQFGGRFVAKPPAAARSTIKGKIADGRVSGSLSDRTKSVKSHRFCTGKATFNLAIPNPKPTSRP